MAVAGRVWLDYANLVLCSLHNTSLTFDLLQLPVLSVQRRGGHSLPLSAGGGPAPLSTTVLQCTTAGSGEERRQRRETVQYEPRAGAGGGAEGAGRAEAVKDQSTRPTLSATPFTSFNYRTT